MFCGFKTQNRNQCNTYITLWPIWLIDLLYVNKWLVYRSSIKLYFKLFSPICQTHTYQKKASIVQCTMYTILEHVLVYRKKNLFQTYFIVSIKLIRFNKALIFFFAKKSSRTKKTHLYTNFAYRLKILFVLFD